MSEPAFCEEAAVASRVVSEALSWLGTPYRHQGARKGVGCDCIGLVRGVWQAVYGRAPEEPEPYAPDWAEAGGWIDCLRQLDAIASRDRLATYGQAI
jgi:NlpC/P60 family putative phage cell wall peptidase